MAYNTQVSDRIREALAEVDSAEEKTMFGGICYKVDGKMCIGVVGDEMMCHYRSGKNGGRVGAARLPADGFYRKAYGRPRVR